MGAGLGAGTGGGGGGGGGEGGAEDADEDCEAWGSAENNAPTEGKDTLPLEVCVYEELYPGAVCPYEEEDRDDSQVGIVEAAV